MVLWLSHCVFTEDSVSICLDSVESSNVIWWDDHHTGRWGGDSRPDGTPDFLGDLKLPIYFLSVRLAYLSSLVLVSSQQKFGTTDKLQLSLAQADRFRTRQLPRHGSRLTPKESSSDPSWLPHLYILSPPFGCALCEIELVLTSNQERECKWSYA